MAKVQSTPDDSPRGPGARKLPADFTMRLQKEIIGQPTALSEIIAIFEQWEVGLEPQGRPPGVFLLLGPTGTGKALPMHTPVLTPHGWVQNKDLKVGDEVCTPNGKTSQIASIHPQGLKETVRLTFRDGRMAWCSKDHLWKIYSNNITPRWQVADTNKILHLLNNTKSRTYVELTEPCAQESKSLKLSPYLMGALLGDGCFRGKGITFSTADNEILGRVASEASQYECELIYVGKYDYAIRGKLKNPVRQAIVAYGLFGKLSVDKFIPKDYLESSVGDRWALLQGLLDTDGTVGKEGSVTFCSISKILAEQVQTLVWSLGGQAKISSRFPKFTYVGVKKSGQTAYVVNIRLKDARKGFTVERKLQRLKVQNQYASRLKLQITQAIDTGISVPMQCIKLADPDGLFIIKDYVVTHNTWTVETLADILLQSPRAFTKIDCAEFQHSHEIAKLLGSPPGYLGHRETQAMLSQGNINRHQTEACKLNLILLDEIEKSSDALWNLLLGILDKGSLTLGDNSKVDFSRSMIFMTSNLGSREMSDSLDPRFGFSGHETHDTPEASIDVKVLESIALGAMKRRFSPEFVNRIDAVLTYRPFTREELRTIFARNIKDLQNRVFDSLQESSFILRVTDETREWLLDQGEVKLYGARRVKRLIEKHVTRKIVVALRAGEIRNKKEVTIALDKGETRVLSS